MVRINNKIDTTETNVFYYVHLQENDSNNTYIPCSVHITTATLDEVSDI